MGLSHALRTGGTLLGALLLLFTAACGDDPSPPPTETSSPAPETSSAAPVKDRTAKSDVVRTAPAPNTLAGFRARMDDLLRLCAEGTTEEAEANARDLLLKDARAFFESTFGADHVEGLVREYAIWHARIPGLPTEVRKSRAEGRTAVLVERFVEPGDAMATAYQSIALRKAKVPLTLYSLRLVKPGEEDGWHLWSFAWVDGAYRFVGRMMAISPETADPQMALMGSLRIKTAREIRAQRADKKADK